YKKAYDLFNFPEVNELGIGLSFGNHGKGLTSPKIRQNTLRIAIDLIKSKEDFPDVFLFVGLLNEGVGVDLISDMLCNIILDDIKNYTREMNHLLFGNEEFKKNELKKNCNIYYLPQELLDEIPIPKFLFDIDEACNLNANIRATINEMVNEEYKNVSKKDKVRGLIDFIVQKKGFTEIFDEYTKLDYQKYDFIIDKVGIVKFIETYLLFPNNKINNITNAKELTL